MSFLLEVGSNILTNILVLDVKNNFYNNFNRFYFKDKIIYYK